MAQEHQEDRAELLRPRAIVTAEELRRMPAELRPAVAQPWTDLGRSAFYGWLRSSGLALRLGGSIRIPTKRFLAALGVLDEE
jgi:hypothetical protein